jgi:hypothetical protein
MLVKGVTIQDLHFGHKATERMYNELNQFKEFLNNNEVHILNFNGDYFDRKLTGTDPHMFYALNFFSEVMDICKKKNIKVRIILGTRSHDLNQVSTMFNHYMGKPELDIKYITTVQSEEILGMNVLYIPEEYPDTLEYYDEYIKGSYAAIHGHGTWDFVNFAATVDKENEERGNGTHTAPIFKYNDWKNSIKDGFAIFGHIHKRQNKANVYYSGSFTRWGYGDRSDKGFMYYEYNTDTKEWKVEYIDNEKAPRYDVIDVTDIFSGIDPNTVEVDEILKILNEQVELTDNLRINLAGLSEDKIKMLKKSYEHNPKVKIEVITKKAKKLMESIEPKVFEKYDYILNRKLPIEETIKRFVLEEKSVDMDLDVIREILNESK